MLGQNHIAKAYNFDYSLAHQPYKEEEEEFYFCGIKYSK
jgi:hypothetical protein